ncbi:rod shape-determining protein RodA [Clostridium sporogenes]|uniref:Peptidoglycan glycosyltransferase RodA n=1 Tax=Clostridium botulinum TaxID=1491 RepID=A0A6M0SVL4_CLOBO|nr:rod shape-determining protein RodA [Clostridium sporogenes]NFA59578.1 rod shape-determining protein RodA [Clostridium botulinum]NFI73408.1 rod shape-determining protein RodA [Clostridium sporogenes]NFL71460.1 rod shape-determining protein RodA [Clostridium sporogenes]NFM23267.1 rod shape-determining protein RodA [Clostridium sporogenes]NFP61344.1 rod shape-determining protein RodA [Clostridium sporogenes]
MIRRKNIDFKKSFNLKRHIKYFDVFLFAMVIFISLFGILMISSATSNFEDGKKYIITQILSLIIGLIFMFIIIYIDYRNIGRAYKIIYIFNFLLLAGVILLGTGKEQWGAQRWIRIGGIGIQPSEIAKIGFIITFAKFLELVKDNLNKIKYLFSALCFVGVPIILVMIQPDLGTALSFIFITITMIYICGIDYKYILGGFLSCIIVIPIAWQYILKAYQKNRILVFLNPDSDPTGGGYHVLQSKISVGSGQFFGTGLFKGTHAQNFLPEKHTDFIFALVGEELGFMGSMILVLLFLIIVLRCISIAKSAKDNLGSYICVGVASMLMFQTFVNIGMCIGIMPVTGIPLPFISYGGSSLVTNFVAMGLVLNVGLRHKPINFYKGSIND